MSTRKELIAEGKDITPLTREEYFLAGKTLEPLNVKEKVLKGVVGGGGGSGDLSFANVRFVSTEGTGYTVHAVPYAVDPPDGDPHITCEELYIGGNGFSVKVPLYKSLISISFNDFENVDTSTPPVLSGAVDFDNFGGFFLISGDCEITCKGTGESPK